MKVPPPVGRFDHEAMRGVLILVVVLDHNDVIRNVHDVNAWFLPMTFHVAGFLLLPFLSPPKRLSGAMVRDHAVRYLVPFLCALLVYAVAYEALVARHTPDLAWAAELGRAAVLADPWSLKHITGYLVLWFLPALLSLVLLAAAFAGSPGLRPVLLVVALVVHLTVGAMPESLKATVPQGLLIALYILPLGLVARHGLTGLASHAGRWIVPACVLVVGACWRLELGHEVEVATLVMPTFRRPLFLVATDLSDLSMLLILMRSSSMLARVPGLKRLGRHSLLVYLIHPLVYKPVLAAALQVCTPALLASGAGAVLYWVGAACTVALAAGLSLGAAILITAWPALRSSVMPRTWADWLPVAVWQKAATPSPPLSSRPELPAATLSRRGAPKPRDGAAPVP